MKKQQVRIKYINHREVTVFRTILPRTVWFGTTEWHPKPQWFLDAHDLDKDALRTFAMQDFLEWNPIEEKEK